MTSQKYICSTEDILKHASKLLKAELPVSIRLIGGVFCITYKQSSSLISITLAFTPVPFDFHTLVFTL